MNPLPLALSASASFVARMFTGNMKEMLTILPRAFEHKGFAFIHALSPCTVFHDTYQLYFKNVKPLPNDHPTDDKFAAIERGASESPIYSGLFFQEERETSESPIYSGLFFQEERETLVERVASVQKSQKQQTSIVDIAKKWSR